MSFNYIPNNKIDVPELQFKGNLKLPKHNTALVIVDMQNDFVHDGGKLVVPAAKETVRNIQKLLDKARTANIPVAFTQDTQLEGDLEFEIFPEHCLKDTKGWQIINELKPQKNELICQKNRYDGFYGTWLEHYLSRVWKVDHLVMVGTVANICVLHTAAAAGLRWFRVVIPADGISALTEFDQAMTLRQVSWLYTGDIVKRCDDIEFE
jgi:nicotinamidase-related amidase